MNWDELSFFSVENGLWTDGTNIYHSFNSYHDYDYVTDIHLILRDNKWVPMEWKGLTSFSRKNIWTDGVNIYYSYYNNQYVLNGDTWEPKTWNGITNSEGNVSFHGEYIWTDGTNIYYSYSSTQYVLNGDTWELKTWNELTSFYGSSIWTDGTNIYYGISTDSSYRLDGDTWVSIPVIGLQEDSNGIDGLWSDGLNIYWSYYYQQQYDYILLPPTAKFYVKDTDTWSALGHIG